MNGISCPGRTFWFYRRLLLRLRQRRGEREPRVAHQRFEQQGRRRSARRGAVRFHPRRSCSGHGHRCVDEQPGIHRPHRRHPHRREPGHHWELQHVGSTAVVACQRLFDGAVADPAGFERAGLVQLHVVHGESWDTAGSSGSVVTCCPPRLLRCHVYHHRPELGAVLPARSASRNARVDEQRTRCAAASPRPRRPLARSRCRGTGRAACCRQARQSRASPQQAKHRESTAAGTVTPSISGTRERRMHDPLDEPDTPGQQQHVGNAGRRAAGLREQRDLESGAPVHRRLHVLGHLSAAQHAEAGAARQHRAHRELHGAGTGDATVRRRAGASAEQCGQREPLHCLSGTDREQQHRRRNHPRSGRLPVAGRGRTTATSSSLAIRVTHGTCTSACQNITSQLDGMELLVSYSAPGRSGVALE